MTRNQIKKITAETIILEKTDHRCTNCKSFEPEHYGSDRGYYCKRRHSINGFPEHNVCREWEELDWEAEDEIPEEEE